MHVALSEAMDKTNFKGFLFSLNLVYFLKMRRSCKNLLCALDMLYIKFSDAIYEKIVTFDFLPPFLFWQSGTFRDDAYDQLLTLHKWDIKFE